MVTYNQACLAPRPPASALSTIAAATRTPITATTNAMSSVVLKAAFVSVDTRRVLRGAAAPVRSASRPRVRLATSCVLVNVLLRMGLAMKLVGVLEHVRRAIPRTAEARIILGAPPASEGLPGHG